MSSYSQRYLFNVQEDNTQADDLDVRPHVQLESH
jgi:hypothetical protein